MADPLSIASSILSLTDAAIIIGKFIHRIRNCPAELLAVNNELSDLRYVLTEVERLQENETVPGGSNLGRILKRAQVAVQEASDIIQKLKGNETGRFSVIDRVKWSVTQKEKVASLISRLREIRFQLDTLIAADTARTIRQVTLAVEKLRLVSIPTQLGTTGDNSSALQAPSASDVDRSVNLEQVNDEHALALTRSQHSFSTEADGPPPSYVSLETIKQRKCAEWCSCQCHTPTYFQSPSVLNQVLGSLFLGYSGSPLRKFECDVPSCAAYSGRAKARAIYLFPSWFISRAIDAAFYRGPFGDISANFRIVGVQQRNSPIFDAVAAGDIDMMQRLFSDGLARPNNIDHEGTTLIFAAVAYRRDHIVKFLLSAGADAHYPNRERISAFDRAWDGIITCRAIHDSSRNSMRDIFNDTRELDSWQLTRLHKIVLGLLPGDLKNELELTKQDINTPDSHERTPLFWAVAVADPAAVETLLEYGADPNITNCAGAPPLRKATAADRLDIFLLLLKHGANPNWKTVLGMQITHTVMSYHLDLQYLEASLNPGLDLNARGGYSGNTPLLIAVRANNTTKTRWLLEHDAEIDKKDKDGYTPLMIAAYRNYSDCVKILLEHGADWTLKVPYGGSIITLVAAYGVRETYNALAAFGAVRGVDLEAKVNYGKSAKDMVFLDGFDPGGKAAYLRLLNTEICERCMLDARSGISAGVSLGRYNFNSSNVHETDEVFHDAKDSQRPSHTHPEVPEGLLDEDLEGEEMVVDDDGRVFVRSLFWPEMWMLQQPGQDLVAQRRIAAMQIDKAIAEAHENEEQKVLAEAEEEEKQEG